MGTLQDGSTPYTSAKHPLMGKPGSERSEGEPPLPCLPFTYSSCALQAGARESGVRMDNRDWRKVVRGYPE